MWSSKDGDRQALLKRAGAWTAAAMIATGLVWPPMTFWTGPLVGAWFISTQKPLGGTLQLVVIQAALTLVQGLAAGWLWRSESVIAHLSVLPVALLPLAAFRLFAPRRHPGLAGLALAGAAMLAAGLAQLLLPDHIARLAIEAPLPAGLGENLGQAPFFAAHAAAGLILWGWLRNGGDNFRAVGPVAVGGALAITLALGFMARDLNAADTVGAAMAFGCVLVLAAVTAVSRARRENLLVTPGAAGLAFLRTPGGSTSLKMAHGRLIGPRGDAYTIRDGIACFASAADVTGRNKDLSALYRNIAGFYDDSQRIYAALTGLDRLALVRDYMADLRVEAGQRVLETSIGTGRSFEVLPPDLEVHGVDLSIEMLEVCRDNFALWKRAARLYAANAEALPFADDVFDRVFHVGGINFFSNPGAAIAEMIRVARPGARILIADETEKHAKAVYENLPATRRHFRDRREDIAPPLMLLPEGVQEYSFRTLLNDEFYVISFTKPEYGRAAAA